MHILLHAVEATSKFIHFHAQTVDFLLISSLGVVALLDLGQEIGTTTLKLSMPEFPKFGIRIADNIADANGVRLDFAKAIKVLNR